MSFIISLRGIKTIQSPCGRRKCTPILACGGTSIEGEVLAALSKERLKLALREAECKSPPPGETSPQATEGVHFHRPQGGCMVFPRAQPGCLVFIPRSGIIKLIARKGDTTPSEPSEPFEPSEPSPLKGKRLTMICASLCSFKSCSLCTPKACPQSPSQPSELLVRLYRIRYSKLFLLFLYFPYKTML